MTGAAKETAQSATMLALMVFAKSLITVSGVDAKAVAAEMQKMLTEPGLKDFPISKAVAQDLANGIAADDFDIGSVH